MAKLFLTGLVWLFSFLFAFSHLLSLVFETHGRPRRIEFSIVKSLVKDLWVEPILGRPHRALFGYTDSGCGCGWDRMSSSQARCR